MKRYLHILLFLFVASGFGSCFSETLYIFFPSTVRPRILQQKFSDANPKIQVIVFGRFVDFRDKMASNPPDAVLSLPIVVETLDSYTIKFKGKKNGEESEPYYLLSVDRNIDIAKANEITIGAVDFLGRKGMKEFVSSMFSSPPAIKTVTKIEDLLPLITFEMANAILVTETQAAYFQSVSNLNFVKTRIPNIQSGAISLAMRTGKEAPDIVLTLKTLDKDLLKLMGNVQWN